MEYFYISLVHINLVSSMVILVTNFWVMQKVFVRTGYVVRSGLSLIALGALWNICVYFYGTPIITPQDTLLSLGVSISYIWLSMTKRVVRVLHDDDENKDFRCLVLSCLKDKA